VTRSHTITGTTTADGVTIAGNLDLVTAAHVAHSDGRVYLVTRCCKARVESGSSVRGLVCGSCRLPIGDDRMVKGWFARNFVEEYPQWCSYYDVTDGEPGAIDRYTALLAADLGLAVVRIARGLDLVTDGHVATYDGIVYLLTRCCMAKVKGGAYGPVCSGCYQALGSDLWAMTWEADEFVAQYPDWVRRNGIRGGIPLYGDFDRHAEWLAADLGLME
jgi:hypothetical protein